MYLSMGIFPLMPIPREMYERTELDVSTTELVRRGISALAAGGLLAGGVLGVVGWSGSRLWIFFVAIL
jgi:hypothetical protein